MLPGLETKIRNKHCFRSKLIYFNAELRGFCGIIWLSKPCLVVRQNMDIFDERELIWLPNVLPLNKRSNQQHCGLKLYKYETM